MGVTIHYRGTIDDLDQVESMEDRLLDLAYALGGRPTIWRSYADHDHQRIVRGLIIDLEPGQDSFSLLISPEGHLTPLFQIKDAELSPFDEPPYCFVKTQFGSLNGHISIVQILDCLRKRFFSNLEIVDEGEYFETRDIEKLEGKRQLMRSAIDSLAGGLRASPLSPEAAEDPEIVATRIERVAALIHERILEEVDNFTENSNKEAEPAEDSWEELSLDAEVDAFDRLQRKSDLRSEQIARRINEALAAGLSIDEALDLAMEEQGLLLPRDGDQQESEFEADVPSEPWLASLPGNLFSEASKDFAEHRAVKKGNEFIDRLMALEMSSDSSLSSLKILARAGFDMVGGLVQATSSDLSDQVERALTISQLKRSRKGHGFARGALSALRREGTITETQATELHELLGELNEFIHELTELAWTIK